MARSRDPDRQETRLGDGGRRSVWVPQTNSGCARRNYHILPGHMTLSLLSHWLRRGFRDPDWPIGHVRLSITRQNAILFLGALRIVAKIWHRLGRSLQKHITLSLSKLTGIFVQVACHDHTSTRQMYYAANF